eukprot:COSAG05_NODE_1849_length_3965_cov_10.605018_5_plen_182_part_00
MNFLETGTIGVKAGPLMAAPDKFSITVQGRGGHGAMPCDTLRLLPAPCLPTLAVCELTCFATTSSLNLLACRHETVDAMLAAGMVITSLQSVVARSIAPVESAVVTVGKLENSLNSTECGCGSTFNVIADSIVSAYITVRHQGGQEMPPMLRVKGEFTRFHVYMYVCMYMSASDLSTHPLR